MADHRLTIEISGNSAELGSILGKVQERIEDLFPAVVVIDLNGFDDVVEHVWGFRNRALAEEFVDAHDGHGYLIHDIEKPEAAP